jgi:hypothetical protein
MERDAQGLEDEAVLMSGQPVLTCGIIREDRPNRHREIPTRDKRRVRR